MSEPLTPWRNLQLRWQQVQQTPAGQSLVSPCMSVCIMKDHADECHGCLRSIDEIARWGMSTPQQQLVVWQRLGLAIDKHFKEG